MGGLSEAARLYHTTRSPMPAERCCTALRRHLCEDGSADRRRREFNHRHAGNVGQPGNLRGASYTPPLNNQTLFRRDAYLCLYCGARFTYSLLSRDHVTPFSRGGHDTWKNVVSACRRCNNAKASRTPEQAGMQLLLPPAAFRADRRVMPEYMFLQAPTCVADQMNHLIGSTHVEPAAETCTLADVNGGAISRGSAVRQLHTRLLRRARRLGVIAAATRRHHIFPGIVPAAAERRHMIPRQQAISEPRAAVQAQIGIAAEQGLIVERRCVGGAARGFPGARRSQRGDD